MMRHPMRSRAARTRRALVARQLLSYYLKGNVESRRGKLAVLDSVGDHFDGEPFRVADGLLAGLPVGDDTAQL